MRVFGVSFAGVYLNGHAVVVAENEERARELVRQLHKCAVPHEMRVHEVRCDRERVVTLTDGDY
jgi:hypothetical protein